MSKYLDVEILSKISHEQVLSYEPNFLNCIRTVGGKEKKKIYIQLQNLKKQEIHISLTLKYETISLKKEKDHVGFQPHQSLTKTVVLGPNETKSESVETYSPYATGSFTLFLESVVSVARKTIETVKTIINSLKALENGEIETMNFIKNYSHRSTIKKESPDSLFLQEFNPKKKIGEAKKKKFPFPSQSFNAPKQLLSNLEKKYNTRKKTRKVIRDDSDEDIADGSSPLNEFVDDESEIEVFSSEDDEIQAEQEQEEEEEPVVEEEEIVPPISKKRKREAIVVSIPEVKKKEKHVEQEKESIADVVEKEIVPTKAPKPELTKKQSKLDKKNLEMEKPTKKPKLFENETNESSSLNIFRDDKEERVAKEKANLIDYDTIEFDWEDVSSPLIAPTDEEIKDNEFAFSPEFLENILLPENQFPCLYRATPKEKETDQKFSPIEMAKKVLQPSNTVE